MISPKNIVITGTSRGIGFELVHQFAKKGHHVIALSRNKIPISNLNFDNIESIAFDITKKESYPLLEEKIQSLQDPIDILINNAGCLINKPFAASVWEDFEKVYATNVFGLAQLTRSILPFMNPKGHVVNISSMGGVQGSVKFAGLAAYSSSKGAVITLTELLAEEYKDKGPSFNTLALGAVQTEMLNEAFPDFKAPLTSEKMASYILDFALNGQNFYNGKVMQVAQTTP